MAFKDWARKNAPRTYKPPNQSPKTTDHVISTETVAQSLEFQPGDHIYYIRNTIRNNTELRFGIFVRYDTLESTGEDIIWAGWGNTPNEARRNSRLPTHTARSRVRAGWPVTSPIVEEPTIQHNDPFE